MSSSPGAAIVESGYHRLTGDPGRGRDIVEVVWILQTVFDDQLQVVALVKDLAMHVGIELRHHPHFAILLGYQLLIHRCYLDEQILSGEEEIGREELMGLAALVPADRKRARLVIPWNAVEVEEESELSFAVMGKVRLVGAKPRLIRQLTPAFTSGT